MSLIDSSLTRLRGKDKPGAHRWPLIQNIFTLSDYHIGNGNSHPQLGFRSMLNAILVTILVITACRYLSSALPQSFWFAVKRGFFCWITS